MPLQFIICDFLIGDLCLGRVAVRAPTTGVGAKHGIGEGGRIEGCSGLQAGSEEIFEEGNRGEFGADCEFEE